MKSALLGFLLAVFSVTIIMFLVFGVVGLEMSFLHVLIVAAVCIGFSGAVGLLSTHRL